MVHESCKPRRINRDPRGSSETSRGGVLRTSRVPFRTYNLFIQTILWAAHNRFVFTFSGQSTQEVSNSWLLLGNILHVCLLWLSGKSPLNCFFFCSPSNVNQELLTPHNSTPGQLIGGVNLGEMGGIRPFWRGTPTYL